ncbi:Hypothetical protein A7982_02163 [Minicystis rosea]|nr:Hypothetical protein A7982_02163 [Minicystis rosea]
MGSTTHDNLISVPFASSERTELRFELVDADRLELDGEGIDIEASGEPAFVEKRSDGMRPFAD